MIEPGLGGVCKNISMLLIVGTIRLPAENLSKVRAAMRAMVESSRAEEGCVEYSYTEDVLDAGLIHVKELWRDQAALDRHFTTGHIARWRASWPQLWTGRLLTALVGLFMLFDVVGKFLLPPQVTEASVRIGVPVHLNPIFGAMLLVCTILYEIPRVATLGAVLLTGYLGGAVAIQMRAGSPLFETLFQVIFGVLA